MALPVNPIGLAPVERLDAELKKQAVPSTGSSMMVHSDGTRSAIVYYASTATDADRSKGDAIDRKSVV